MLVRVTRAGRRFAAIVVAALYALCVVAPSTAIAFGPGGRTAHCFTEAQLGLAHVHQATVGLMDEGHAKVGIHADGTTHRHHGTHHQGTSENRNDPAACCGLFGLTAMTANQQLDLAAPERKSSTLPIFLETLTGRGPDPINRPPIASPSP
jgi:hypothetical protein